MVPDIPGLVITGFMQSKIASAMIAAIFVFTTGVLPDDTFAQSNKKGSLSAIASKSSKGKRDKAKSKRQTKEKSSQGGGKSRGQSGKKGISNGPDSTRGSLGSSNGSGSADLTSQVPATNTTQYAATPIPSTVETTTAIDAERDPADREDVEIDYYGNLVPRTGRLDHKDRPECLVAYDLCLIDEIPDPQRGHETEVKYQELVTKLGQTTYQYNNLMLELGDLYKEAAQPPDPERGETEGKGALEYAERQLWLWTKIERQEQLAEILRKEIVALEQELAVIVNDLYMAFSKKECLNKYRWCEYDMDHTEGEEGSDQDASPPKLAA